MKISLQEDPMVVSNRIKFIFSKYSQVFLFFDGFGLNISYVDWVGERHQKLISELT
jgi:hypothetical protein